MEELKQAAKYYLGKNYEKYEQEARQNRESMEELYIRKTKISIRKCNACLAILPGFYFCCTECESYNGYNLCLKCFYDETLGHEHEHDSFADNHSILTMVKKGSRYPPCEIQKKPRGKSHRQPPVRVQQTTELRKGKGKQDLQLVAAQYCTGLPAETTRILEKQAVVINEGMEKLGRIAKAHHKAATQEIRDAADAFCQSMFPQSAGGNSRNSLTQNDFLDVMKKKGYPKYADEDLFRMLAKDGNHVTMSEALTLYYILLTGRPFCSGCEHFIPDIFFCCSKCPAAKYALCLECYEKAEYVRHIKNKHHKGNNDGVFFWDYTVLQSNCISATPNLQTNLQPNPAESSKAIAIKDNNQKEKMAIFAAALNTCTAVLNIAAALCTIM